MRAIGQLMLMMLMATAMALSRIPAARSISWSGRERELFVVVVAVDVVPIATIVVEAAVQQQRCLWEYESPSLLITQAP